MTRFRGLECAENDVADEEQSFARVVMKHPVGEILLCYRDVQRIEVLLGGRSYTDDAI